MNTKRASRKKVKKPRAAPHPFSQRVSRATDTRRLVFSPTELMAVLGISLPTIRELIKTGKLRTIKIGARVKIPKHVVDEFLAGR